MDIRNPDLTKKVLAALNPNKIFDEDTFEKQRDMVRKQKPYGRQIEDEAQQKVIRQSTEKLDNEIKKQTTSTALGKLARGARNATKRTGKAIKQWALSPESPESQINSQNTTRRLNIRSGINQQHLNKWKSQKRKTSSPASPASPSASITVEPTRKQKKSPLGRIFPKRTPKNKQPTASNII